MAAITSSTLVPVQEYIARFVDANEKPACEYIDGVLIPKPMGTKQHGLVQVNIAAEIRSRYKGKFRAITELTTKLREGQYYVPDIAVEDLSKPIEGRYPGPKDPVFLCVEIISPPDRLGRLMNKCEEYHAWGVPYCWVIDPERKIAWEYLPGDLEPRKVTDALRAGEIQLSLDEVFYSV